MSNKGSKGLKVLSGSFWLIMAIHLIVFTCVGLFTPRGWTLLGIFLGGMAVLAVLYIPVLRYAKRHPEKAWMRELPFVKKYAGKRTGD